MQMVIIYLALAAVAGTLAVSMMPDLNVDFTAYWNTVGTILNYGFYFIPVGTFLWCLGIFLAIQSMEFVWAGMMWIIRRIPGQG